MSADCIAVQQVADTHNARHAFAITYHVTHTPNYVMSEIHRGF